MFGVPTTVPLLIIFREIFFQEKALSQSGGVQLINISIME
jgi:hypothetical protein